LVRLNLGPACRRQNENGHFPPQFHGDRIKAILPPGKTGALNDGALARWLACWKLPPTPLPILQTIQFGKPATVQIAI
jgi:hypothetical protein